VGALPSRHKNVSILERTGSRLFRDSATPRNLVWALQCLCVSHLLESSSFLLHLRQQTFLWWGKQEICDGREIRHIVWKILREETIWYTYALRGIILKWVLLNTVWGCGLNSVGFWLSWVAKSLERGTESLGSLNWKAFHDQLRDYQLHKRDCAPCSNVAFMYYRLRMSCSV
jgi:hypothetical protein